VEGERVNQTSIKVKRYVNTLGLKCQNLTFKTNFQNGQNRPKCQNNAWTEARSAWRQVRA
jgi:hypothetical protein